MKSCSLPFLLLALPTAVNAIFADEAGLNDFVIPTAGHGLYGVTHAHLLPSRDILTFSRNDCYATSRNLQSGVLSWRRNICTTANTAAHDHLTGMYYEPALGHFYTLDGGGTVREWRAGDGALLSSTATALPAATAAAPIAMEGRVSVQPLRVDGEIPPRSDSEPIMLAFLYPNGMVGTRDAKNVSVEIATTDLETAMDSEMVLQERADDGAGANFAECGDKTVSLQLGFGVEEKKLRWTVLEGIDDGAGSTRQLSGWSMDTSNDEVRRIHLLGDCADNGGDVLVTTFGGTTIALTIDLETYQVVEHWRAEEALASIQSSIFLDVTHATDDELDEESQEGEEAIITSLSFSARLQNQIHDLSYFLSGGMLERIYDLYLLSSSDTTTPSRTGPTSKDYSFGLTKVAVMLSTHHLAKLMGIDTATQRHSNATSVLWTLPLDRNAVWHRIVHGATTGRSSVFGHGSHHPHSHEILILSHPQLSSSSKGAQLEWHCIDGVKGTILSHGTQTITSPVVQVLPVHTSTLPSSHGKGGGCRQNAVLVHADDTVTALPPSAAAAVGTEGAVIAEAIEGGLYTHFIGDDGDEDGRFRSLKIVPFSSSSESGSSNVVGQAVTIGETIFDPAMEKIKSVTYPQRNEVVQSPTTIVGDDSLLLKYLNPHLCVVVTEATEAFIAEVSGGGDGEGEEVESEGRDFYHALGGGAAAGAATVSAAPKKPVGATQPGEDVPVTQTAAAAPPVPSLFINLVDTVSGQIVYRVSHAHGTSSGDSGTSEVPVVISENWIIYAFSNHRTRRTELGVLTLHEGMIDKHGISMFSSPQQQLTFSSMSSPKPVVLTKTFGFARPVSALGVTNTRGGISAKSLLLATGVSGQIVRVDRRLLDPRRPAGTPKLTEKKEGLMQYSPLIPISPIHTPSYSNNIERVSSIISTAANLESQTLVLAYGGPDIFFTRFAPSKGFDSLPENFNKLLLLLVLIALFVGLMKAKSMAGKKAVKFGWS